MSGMHWCIVATLNTPSPEGIVLDGLDYERGRRYEVIGRAGPHDGVLLRLHENYVQAKLPRMWSGSYRLAFQPHGPPTRRLIGGRECTVFERHCAAHHAGPQHVGPEAMSADRTCEVCGRAFVFTGSPPHLIPPHRLAERVPNAKGTWTGQPVYRGTGPWCTGAER